MLTSLVDAITRVEAKDWILLVIGAMIPIAGKAAQVTHKYFTEAKRVAALLGEWHTYHWSRRNYEAIFRSEKWIIKNTFTGIKISTVDESKKELRYHGKIILESSCVVIHFTGELHGETWSIRASTPIPNDDTMMLGLFIGEDFDHEDYSALLIACRNPRDIEGAKVLLTRFCASTPSEHAIRIRKELNS